MAQDAIVEVVQVRKSFGGKPILKGVDLDVPRGRITTIIGGSGSGKSVLVKHIIGLLKPDEGEVRFEGEDICRLGSRALAAVRRNFGMLFQHSALFDSMTVEENIAFPLVEHTKLSGRKIRDIVREKLELLDMAGIERQFPSELSGGMRKRVGLARAIVLNPKIIIYDEPTTGLDPIMTQNVDQMIKEAERKFNVTSIVISHDMASTFRISDHIAVIHEGRIVEHGSGDRILRSDNEYVRRFLAAAASPQRAALANGGDA
ncbi:MAG: ABC transporter ATP-binding protein [Deltaproteobacteria bacterium]|nr:ABC transporter ATP-binding protein [Deltaproteobacteria bacterium]